MDSPPRTRMVEANIAILSLVFMRFPLVLKFVKGIASWCIKLVIFWKANAPYENAQFAQILTIFKNLLIR